MLSDTQTWQNHRSGTQIASAGEKLRQVIGGYCNCSPRRKTNSKSFHRSHGMLTTSVQSVPF